MYDVISGRQGFEVLSDKVVFKDGSVWKFDGSSGSLQKYCDREHQTLSFSSKEELVSHLEATRIDFLLERLEEVQSKSQDIEKETTDWMAKAAQLVLIDDPFASVDGPTGQHIFTELLLGPVMRGRTRLVVTQPARARLQHFDRIILFEDGCVVEAGAPSEVMETEAFKRIEQQPIDDELDGEQASAPVADAAQSVLLAQQANDEGGMLLREEEVHENITWDSISWWLQAAGPLNLFLLVGAVALRAVMAACPSQGT
ncbi:ABCC11 [Symbiodinium natans]|uniref:ABCC11 protein n=1 Tax=Symbiodinium natans TaxID=878477 RepID=A0A812PZG6_9DINO|nr:ABCC11 [Symbiodinium natans]